MKNKRKYTKENYLKNGTKIQNNNLYCLFIFIL